jgi:hypothetical protein
VIKTSIGLLKNTFQPLKLKREKEKSPQMEALSVNQYEEADY